MYVKIARRDADRFIFIQILDVGKYIIGKIPISLKIKILMCTFLKKCNI